MFYEIILEVSKYQIYNLLIINLHTTYLFKFHRRILRLSNLSKTLKY